MSRGPTGEVGGTEGSCPQSLSVVQGVCSAREGLKGGALLPVHPVLGVPTACLQPLGWPEGSWSPAQPRGEGVRAAALLVLGQAVAVAAQGFVSAKFPELVVFKPP